MEALTQRGCDEEAEGGSKGDIFNYVTFLLSLSAIVVAIRALVFSSCMMWEVRDISSVGEGYTWGRCIQQQLLTDSVRELEVQLD